VVIECGRVNDGKLYGGVLGMPESPITPAGFNTAAQLCCL